MRDFVRQQRSAFDRSGLIAALSEVDVPADCGGMRPRVRGEIGGGGICVDTDGGQIGVEAAFE
ncbi:MAG: hypothetical protein WA009_14385, partial [Phototrophicaceae bacterium]